MAILLKRSALIEAIARPTEAAAFICTKCGALVAASSVICKCSPDTISNVLELPTLGPEYSSVENILRCLIMYHFEITPERRKFLLDMVSFAGATSAMNAFTYQEAMQLQAVASYPSHLAEYVLGLLNVVESGKFAWEPEEAAPASTSSAA
jgi:hypothetical protein